MYLIAQFEEWVRSPPWVLAAATTQEQPAPILALGPVGGVVAMRLLRRGRSKIEASSREFRIFPVKDLTDLILVTN